MGHVGDGLHIGREDEGLAGGELRDGGAGHLSHHGDMLKVVLSILPKGFDRAQPSGFDCRRLSFPHDVGGELVGQAESIAHDRADGLEVATLAQLQNRAHALALRHGAQPGQQQRAAHDVADWPQLRLWLWALASAGLPLLLPLMARSLASASAEGALSVFTYGWKLVELPLVLLVQLVATLTFPAIAQALAGAVVPGGGAAALPTGAAPAWAQPLRSAFALSWWLACASAAGLLWGAPVLAQLLFGWGRVAPAALEQVAAWGRVGAWSLLPQALLAVLMTLLASTARLRVAVAAYAAALLALALGAALLHTLGRLDGQAVLWLLNAALALAAAMVLGSERRWLRAGLPWRAGLAPLLALLLLALLAPAGPAASLWQGLGWAALAAALVLLAGWLGAPELRRAWRS